MINFYDYANRNKTELELRACNKNWQYISDHP